MKFILPLYITAAFLLGVSQVEGIAQQPQTGALVLTQDSRIPLLVQRHIQYNNRQNGVMDGYRVQIFFDSGSESKKRAMEARTEFQIQFHNVPVYLSFQEPFYKVRAGDYRYRIEADGLLEHLKGIYPNAYTVKDRINYPRLD